MSLLLFFSDCLAGSPLSTEFLSFFFLPRKEFNYVFVFVIRAVGIIAQSLKYFGKSKKNEKKWNKIENNEKGNGWKIN